MTTGLTGRQARAAVRRTRDRSAELLMQRTLALGFLPGTIVFGALALPEIRAQWHAFPVWWSITAIAVTLVAPLLIGALSFGAPVRLLRLIGAISALGTLLCEALIPLVVVAPGDVGPSGPWLLDVIALGVVASAVAWRSVPATAVTVGAAVFSIGSRGVGTTGPTLLLGIQTCLYVLLFDMTLLALAVSARQAGMAVDRARTAAVGSATAAAADAARERERSSVNALVHDSVLATLLAAAQGDVETAPLSQADAQRALDGLTSLLHGDESRGPATPRLFAWTIQALTTELAPSADFHYRATDEGALPAGVAEAMQAAFEEALRNSLLHAGGATSRSVHVDAAADRVDIDVLDDGAGFDMARVPPTRLGIERSIVGRMQAMDGGAAEVASTPGEGTRVAIRWRAP